MVSSLFKITYVGDILNSCGYKNMILSHIVEMIAKHNKNARFSQTRGYPFKNAYLIITANPRDING